MSGERYSIVFRGDIVIGKQLSEVKQALLAIFKVDQNRIDSLFTGRPTTLKVGLTHLEAEKYQAVLQKAGIVVSILEQSSSANASSRTLKPQSTKTLSADSDRDADKSPIDKGTANVDESAPEYGWQLAPVGSFLQYRVKKTDANQQILSVNIDHLRVMPQEGNLLKDSERPKALAPAVDIESVAWDLTPFGESLLKAEEKKRQPSADIDTSALTLSENNGNLIDDKERKVQPEIHIDTSHLSLVSEEDLEKK